MNYWWTQGRVSEIAWRVHFKVLGQLSYNGHVARNGTKTGYHMCVKLSKIHRWLQVKKFLQNTTHIICHFSNVHSNYYSAWQYVTKDDTSYIQSTAHPDLVNSGTPTSESCQGNSKGKRKRRRLSAFEVSEIIVSKKIKSRTELLALAHAQKVDGKTDLAEFIVNRGQKCVEETLKVSVIHLYIIS